MIELEPNALSQSCDSFVQAFENAEPDSLADFRRGQWLSWKGDRLALHYDWSSADDNTVAFIRFTLIPEPAAIWIGSLEVHPHRRGQRIGSGIVRAVEAAALSLGSGTIRLFSRHIATGFWLRMGYLLEADPRYLRKSLPAEPARQKPKT